jgi:putative transposase
MKMRQRLEISERRACGLIQVARTTVRRVLGETDENAALKVRIIDLAHARRRFGYRRIHDLLRREGVAANHKRIYPIARRRSACASAGAGNW